MFLGQFLKQGYPLSEIESLFFSSGARILEQTLTKIPKAIAYNVKPCHIHVTYPKSKIYATQNLNKFHCF